MMQALLNRILQDGPHPKLPASAAVPSSNVAADMEDLGSQACPPCIFISASAARLQMQCLHPSDQSSHSKGHELGLQCRQAPHWNMQLSQPWHQQS